MYYSASFKLHMKKSEDVVIKVGFYDHLQDPLIILRQWRR